MSILNLLGAISPAVWITLAGAFFTLGYLIINQALLRVMFALGSIAYLNYYFTAADEPLWGAIWTTIIMMTANLIGLATLLLRNAKLAVPARHRDIYPKLQPMIPGDFRALLRRAQRYVVKEETVVTVQDQHPDKVFFVISGAFQASKFGLTFQMEEATFVGEVAYLRNSPSAATTTFPAGTEVLEWDRVTLDKASKRNPRFKLALEAVMSRDLARKVALAVAPAVSNSQRAGNP